MPRRSTIRTLQHLHRSTRRRGVVYGVAVSLVLLLSGCHAAMSIFVSAGPQAALLSTLAWVLIAAAALVFFAVVAFLIAAIGRRRHESTAVDLTPRPDTIALMGGALIPAGVLVALFMASVLTERKFPAEAGVPAARYTVVGHQWWWEVRDDGPRAGDSVRFANELHIPVGQVVELRLLSADVIHSFWIPQLHGKMDLIPGDTNRIRLIAGRPGVFRGQCAEYCGLEHAHMAFTVVAEPPGAYLLWLADQRRDADTPADDTTRLGDSLVTRGPCAACHTIRGTAAHGTLGPDLTHIGSRRTIAAGTLPNNPATMEAWITNAQSLKPGVLMPALPQFTGVQLRAMTAYLEGLR